MAVRDVVQAAAGVGGGDKLYVEDVFSTYLYTGNGSTQTITNGIDLAGEGGLVWSKSRSSAYSHGLYDTVRGATKELKTDATTAQSTDNGVTAFNSDGYDVGARFTTNNSGDTYASWTFRKAPKFFDVVTYTGSSSTQNIPHNLGSVPGMIIVKRINLVEEWFVYHRSLGASLHLKLNDADFAGSSFQPWNNTAPTDSVFTVLGGRNEVNNTGSTYVAYLFAHDAGGFGDDGLQNVISCGSYTGNGSTTGPTVTLGYEPQWVLIKSSSNSSNWILLDNMRGVVTGGDDQDLYANSTYVGSPVIDFLDFTATGFIPKSNTQDTNSSGWSYIYIAIRRPMKTPESGTEVFEPDLSPNSNNPRFISGFPVDMALSRSRISTGVEGMDITSRLTHLQYMRTGSTNAEATSSTIRMDYMNGFDNDGDTSPNWVAHMFRRAPGFFDVVAYTGDATIGRAVPHNLTVAPELIILKNRSLSGGGAKWVVASSITAPNEGSLSSSNGFAAYGNITAFGSTTFTLLNGASEINNSSYNYIAYLFASLPGVSKVGSYTGTGTTQTINCGFSSGARFVLIKRTDSTGDWYVWDSARGIVAGNDPYLLLNTIDAEVTSTDYIDPAASGFEISSTAPAAINASGGSFVFLAIA